MSAPFLGRGMINKKNADIIISSVVAVEAMAV
jgi:hypothetical protein